MDWQLSELEERSLSLLGMRLDRLTARRIPVRGVSAGPVARVARLRFGDGTTLLVRAERPGASARIVKAISDGFAVLLEGREETPEGLRLRLTVRARRPISLHLYLLGADQPD